MEGYPTSLTLMPSVCCPAATESSDIAARPCPSQARTFGDQVPMILKALHWVTTQMVHMRTMKKIWNNLTYAVGPLLGSSVNRSARSQRRVWGPSTWSFCLAPSVDSFAIHRYNLRLSRHPREEDVLRQKERSSETKSLRSSSAVRERRSR